MTDKVPTPAPAAQREKRLRLAGVIVLGMGIVSAGLIYWTGSRSADLADDPAMARYFKAESRNQRIMSGKLGQTMEDFSDELKQPGTQALLIVAATALVAWGCFYFARPLESDHKPASENRSPDA